MGRRARLSRNGAAAASSSAAGPAVSGSSSGPAVSGSTGEMRQKTAAAPSSGAQHPEKGAAATDWMGGDLNKAARASSGAEHRAAGTEWIRVNPNEAARDSSGGVPTVHPGKGAAGTVSSVGMLDKKAAAASSGEAPTARHGKVVTNTFARTWEAVGARLSEEMPQKNALALSGDSPSVGAFDGNTTAQDCEKIPQKHCTEDKADMGLSGGMLQKENSKPRKKNKKKKQNSKVEADTAKDIEESDSDEIAYVNAKATEIKEAKLLIEKLNDLRIGEPISEQEFLDYFDNLARQPPWIDLQARQKNEDLAKQYDRHALCRLRYYKHKLKQASEEELRDDNLKSILDISEDDCNKEFLKEEGFFMRFEEDKRFDWFFHPDYFDCSFLDDYQRLVLKNHGYSKWSEYHAYLHSYEMEREYVRYCEELSKQLKWMEPYVDMDRQSVKWGKISSRGALQAIKIAATSFHKITSCLAFTGYYECKESMAYDIFWFKEYDGVYFEIWRRVTQGTSFEKALGEVYNLNMFPLRQRMMKAALEYDETMKMMEDEFLTCTAGITPEVKDDKAKELIAEAVNKRIKKPKSYEEYIIKKIHIARIIGILDSDEK